MADFAPPLDDIMSTIPVLQNVAAVMSAMAQLLRVPVPTGYQQMAPVGPQRSSLALLAGVRVPMGQVLGALGTLGVRGYILYDHISLVM